ncbi:pentafunctional protein [Lichtheimia corymbifera JMRC:FSU:9682]|uniref:3-dehydroquinate synthase n=1 Tax=Lichtheimia corymbifera JMRC:FSU:9682 TaxID=1263082 RepID=A0A068S3J5_9FUNG|nr:pentafunctional protein [Lichtheimia corymbifera JMRC:FSU:9682]
MVVQHQQRQQYQDPIDLVRVSVLDTPDMVHMGFHLTEHIASDLFAVVPVTNYVVITDTHLAELHLPTLVESLQAQLPESSRLLVHVLPPGEQTKTREAKAGIEDFLLDNACTRDTCLIALGGGVVGDLVGFVAATFMRGIPIIQVPTTLLAMVDSSIGGKTAVDTPHGKNLIGSFWQPKRIYMDLALLHTLPDRELANGMAEVIKTAAIWSQSDFENLEHASADIKAAIAAIGQQPITAKDDEGLRLRDLLMHTILAAVRVKAEVVSNDERESGLRGLLNYGHTVGHAFEMLLTPGWLHGECVAVGMLVEAEIACALGHCHPSVVDRLQACLKKHGLPTQLTEPLLLEDVMRIMKVDKKNKGTHKRMVILTNIGTTLEQRATLVSDTAIQDVLRQYMTFHPSSYPGARAIPQQQHKGAAESSLTTMKSGPCIILCGEPMEWIRRTFVPAFIASSGGDYSVHQQNMPIGTSNQLLVLDDIRNVDNALLQTRKDNNATMVVVRFTYEGGSTTLDPSMAWYEYVLVKGDNGDGDASLLRGALDFLQGLAEMRPRHRASSLSPCSTPSYFVTPTITDYASVSSHQVNHWLQQADAVEMRADLLDGPETLTHLGKQLALLRQRTQKPIIFTIRTQPQGGKFDASNTALYAEWITWAHRWGCEYVDIEFTTLPAPQLERILLLNRTCQTVQCILSFHDLDHSYPWSGPRMIDLYERACALSNTYLQHDPAIIKLVGVAHSTWDNLELDMFRRRIDPTMNKKLILINMGQQGRISRVKNTFLTPATHPALPHAAAPGQLSIIDVQDLRSRLGLFA